MVSTDKCWGGNVKVDTVNSTSFATLHYKAQNTGVLRPKI